MAFTFMFIRLCISCSGQILLFLNKSPYQSINAKYFSLVFATILVIAVPAFTIMTNKLRPILDLPKEKAKISNFYEGIHIWRDRDNVWYFRSFMIRRILFAAIPALFPEMSFLQVQLILVLNFWACMWYSNLQPHSGHFRTRLEMFNELMLLAITYHLPLMTDFNLSERLNINVGYSLCGFTTVIILVHLVFIIKHEFYRVHNQKMLLWKQREWAVFLESRKERQVLQDIQD